jgi:hypothetical protein
VDAEICNKRNICMLQISGSVVTPLKVSLSRQQYEQLLDTLDSLMVRSVSEETVLFSSRRLVDIKEEEGELHTGVSTLNMDPALRARMLNVGTGKPKVENQHTLTLKGNLFSTKIIWMSHRICTHTNRKLHEMDFTEICLCFSII